MRRFGAAIRCLTVLPIGPRGPIAEADLGGSFLWFPLVGLGIGAVLAAVHAVASRVLSPLAAAACVVLAWVVVTGALHLDGLGDVADGLYAGRTREDRLRIMKDPHIGTMAVVAVAMCLILKVAFVSSLLMRDAARALLVVPCVGRYAMVLLGSTLPSARGGTGTAAPFVKHASTGSLLAATALTALASWLALGPFGILLFSTAFLASLLLRSVFRRTLGGISGDGLGAAGEVTEVLGLFVILLTG